MTDRIRSILKQLEQTREDLLALSDDIWLSIDHNDSQALEDGVAFNKHYNGKVAAFDVLAGESFVSCRWARILALEVCCRIELLQALGAVGDEVLERGDEIGLVLAAVDGAVDQGAFRRRRDGPGEGVRAARQGEANAITNALAPDLELPPEAVDLAGILRIRPLKNAVDRVA